MNEKRVKKAPPSIDEWLQEAKAHQMATRSGMFLIHNGVVRETPKAQVRQGIDDGSVVTGMEFSYDAAKVDKVITETLNMEGIFHVKVWLNEGQLEVGDDIMYVLIGGDIRPRVIDALQFLVGKIKNECVIEIEKKRDFF
jgi:molybdopterin synthase catalytic subunit